MKDTWLTNRPSPADNELIVTAMTYLKYHDSNNATREDAISLLAFMQTAAKEVSTAMTEEAFDKYYDFYKAQK